MQKSSEKLKIVYNLTHIAGVAQLVEQLICNQPVAGSSPISSSNKIKPCELLQPQGFFVV
jgi:hypothetical protein